MDIRERATGFIRSLPVAHRVGIVAAVVALGMASVVFMGWVTTPSYTVLYSGLDEASVSGVIDELEALGVPYELESGGTTVMVPREQLYATRASLAGAGIGGSATPQGYELLQEQGLSVSDFRQRVDYQRALEGEVAKTLMAMEGIDAATVRLVLPEDELFAEEQEAVTASVLLAPNRELDEGEVETVSFLVASSVEGLDVDDITIADTDGTVLHAPGEAGGSGGATDRTLRQTRGFEQALAGDVTGLLARATGGEPASVVVRATLNYDEQQVDTETFDPERQVVLREQTTGEQFEGVGGTAAGVVGVDGGPPEAATGAESNYQRDESVTENGVDRTTSRTITAPGAVERLSVAIVMDDGSLTGATVPPPAEVERLVTAALGLDAARGDTVAVTVAPFPALDAEADEAPPVAVTDQLPRIAGLVVLVLVALALFLMTRRRRTPAVEVVSTQVIDLPSAHAAAHPQGPAQGYTQELDEPAQVPLTADLALAEGAVDPDALGDGAEGQAGDPHAPLAAAAALRLEVTDLVQRQPEEIAALLRNWLTDRKVDA